MTVTYSAASDFSVSDEEDEDFVVEGAVVAAAVVDWVLFVASEAEVLP